MTAAVSARLRCATSAEYFEIIFSAKGKKQSWKYIWASCHMGPTIY